MTLSKARQSLLRVQARTDWLNRMLFWILGIILLYIAVIAICQYFGVQVPNIMWTIGDVIAFILALHYGFRLLVVTYSLSDIYVALGDESLKNAKRAFYFTAFVIAFIALVVGIAGSSRVFASLGIAVD